MSLMFNSSSDFEYDWHHEVGQYWAVLGNYYWTGCLWLWCQLRISFHRVSRSVLFLAFPAIMVSGSSGTSDVKGLGVIWWAIRKSRCAPTQNTRRWNDDVDWRRLRLGIDMMHITDQTCPKSLVIDEYEYGEDDPFFLKEWIDSLILIQVLAGLGIVCRDKRHMYTFLSKPPWIHLQIRAPLLILRLRVAPHRKKKLLTGVSNQMYRYNCLQARVSSKSPIRLPPLQEPPNAATLPADPVALRHLRGIPSYADAVMLQGLLWKRVSRHKHLGKKRMNWLTLTSSSFWEKVYWWYICIGPTELMHYTEIGDPLSEISTSASSI